MNKFIRAMQSNDATTFNGAVTHSTSSNSLVDLFFVIGSFRSKDRTELDGLFSNIVNQDEDTKNLLIKMLFYARDIRGGLGERETFRYLMKRLWLVSKSTFNKNAHLIPEYGRWDDVVDLYISTLSPVLLDIIRKGIEDKNMLLGKWMPRRGYSAVIMRNALKLKPKAYRKLIVGLTNVVETKMCSKEWETINYKHVPGLAALRYKDAFKLHDNDRYSQFVESIVKGETQVKSTTLFPHDIVKVLLGSEYRTPDKNSSDVKYMIEAWKGLTDYMEGSDKCGILPIIDVSGTMYNSTGSIFSAIALGLYLSERNRGTFKDAFITFSQYPEFQYVNGDIYDRVIQTKDAAWTNNTDLIAVFNLILSKAKEEGLNQEDMPKSLLILSDMEFDVATRGSNTNFDEIKELYSESGYALPKIVFWNLNARVGNNPVKFDENGTALISGFSPSVMKPIIKNLVNDNLTPMSIVRDALEVPRYKDISW